MMDASKRSLIVGIVIVFGLLVLLISYYNDRIQLIEDGRVMKTTIAACQNNIKLCNDEMSKYQADEKKLRQQNSDTTKQLEEQKVQVAAMVKEIETLKKSTEELKKKLAASESASSTSAKEVVDLKKKVTEREKEVAELKQKVSDTEKLAMKLVAAVGGVEGQLSAAVVTNAEGVIFKLKNKIANLTATPPPPPPPPPQKLVQVVAPNKLAPPPPKKVV